MRGEVSVVFDQELSPAAIVPHVVGAGVVPPEVEPGKEDAGIPIRGPLGMALVDALVGPPPCRKDEEGRRFVRLGSGA